MKPSVTTNWCRQHSSGVAIALFLLMTVAVTWLWAHEGHAPLPTRGVQVDADKGTITLSPEARSILDVRTDEVRPRVADDRVLAYATLVAPWQQHAFVSTRMPGRIVQLLAKPGQAVDKGELLAEVQSLEFEDLQLEILNLRTAEMLAVKVMEQTKTLAADGSVAEKEYLEAVNKHQQVRNGLVVAKAKWASIGLGTEALDSLLNGTTPPTLGVLPLHSTLSGTIIHADVSVGRFVEPSEHLFEVVDLSKVWVKIGVLERDLHRVNVGQPVELRLSAYPDEILPATVEIKSLYLDPQSHLGTVWAQLINVPGREPRFLPGMHGQVEIVLSSAKPRLTVPITAVVSDGPERFVLVENAATAAASEYQKRSIVTGVQDGAWIQVLGGEIFAGDRVVTTGLPQMAAFFVPGVLRPSPEAAKNMGLVVEPVSKHVVERIMEVQGAVDVPPNRRSSASSQLPGKIQSIAIERNQSVQKGDVLAEVASLELQKLQLDLLQAYFELALTEANLERFRKIEAVISRRQVWETESQRNELLNRRNSIIRKLEAVGLSKEQIEGVLQKKQIVDTFPVRAPRSGVVVHFDKALGQVIKADEPLFEIHDLSQAFVQAFLSEREWASVKAGQKARIRLVADPTFLAEGTVTRNARNVSADDRVVPTWVELDGQQSKPLQHNLMARLTVVLEAPSSTTAVPASALVWEGTKSYVFVEKEGGVFHRRHVETGRSDDRYVEIVGGLTLGEPIAVQGTAAMQTAFANIR
jgi:cobalt-zinc-cadmium efflux system membrane fusion protein